MQVDGGRVYDVRPLLIESMTPADSPVCVGASGGRPGRTPPPATGRCAAPPLVADNKEIVQLKAFPAAVPGDGPYNSRAGIVCLDSMRDGEIGCLIVP